MSMYTTERRHQTSNNRCLTDAELEEVNGGIVPSTMACIHSAFIASASDLLTGGKGFAAVGARNAVHDYLMGH